MINGGIHSQTLKIKFNSSSNSTRIPYLLLDGSPPLKAYYIISTYVAKLTGVTLDNKFQNSGINYIPLRLKMMMQIVKSLKCRLKQH